MSRGINIAEQCHVVNATPPIDINASGADSDIFSMKHAAHATIICCFGVEAASSTITVKENTSSTGAGATAIDFKHYKMETASSDTLTSTSATTSGITGSTAAGAFYVIELDADELSDGSNWVSVHASDPSAAKLYSCVAILSGHRYHQSATPTAIA